MTAAYPPQAGAKASGSALYPITARSSAAIGRCFVDCCHRAQWPGSSRTLDLRFRPLLPRCESAAIDTRPAGQSYWLGGTKGAACPSGLRERIANPRFVGSNPTAAFAKTRPFVAFFAAKTAFFVARRFSCLARGVFIVERLCRKPECRKHVGKRKIGLLWKPRRSRVGHAVACRHRESAWLSTVPYATAVTRERSQKFITTPFPAPPFPGPSEIAQKPVPTASKRCSLSEITDNRRKISAPAGIPTDS